jgi:hypothetical protein
MALASVNAQNQALNGLDASGSPVNLMGFVSLHVGSTGAPVLNAAGANENANAGSYARQACTWNAAASGSKTNSSALTFTTLGTIAVTHFGTSSVITYNTGPFGLGGALSSSVTAVTITVAAGALTLSAS